MSEEGAPKYMQERPKGKERKGEKNSKWHLPHPMKSVKGNLSGELKLKRTNKLGRKQLFNLHQKGLSQINVVQVLSLQRCPQGRSDTNTTLQGTSKKLISWH